ncbi:MAG: ATP-binding cassette domain-containing protein [Legionellales bacterium]|nr:ATP-binding cassette domain-containing protein [Legionellales bacterium]
MPLINLIDISIHFGTAPLLDKINLAVEEGEHIAIIGRNGMGKSTLLKIIDSKILPDSGEVIRHSSARIARLEQDIPSHIEGTVLDVITAGLGEQAKLITRYETLTHQLTTDQSEGLLKELEHVQHQLDEHQAWNLTHKIEHIIEKLALPSEQLFSELSGGLKRRVLLGQALVNEPNLLLLDEPTNHLDIDSITWLEDFLNDFAGAVIFITHDRMFMQKVAKRIIDIDRGNIRSYPGNYDQYLERKQHELEIEEVHNRNFDKKLADEEIWIRQGIKARRTRNEGRVRALEKLREIRNARREVIGKADMQLQEANQSGKIVIEAQHIEASYQGKTLIRPFSTTIMRGDRIGIIGANGAGKSTLLKILLGEILPQQGTVKRGTKLEIAYFDQLRSQLDENKSVADNVSYGDQFVTVNGKPVHIIGYLQNFLFTPDRARTPVRSLSGGERNRLLLARLFTQPSNLLVMDEPTNDLDMETLELLEELITNYEGTLLIVSHDRRFLNNVVTSTLVFEGEGQLREYVGGYDDWLRQRSKTLLQQPSIPKVIPTAPAAIKPVASTSTKSYQQQKELKAIETKISTNEKKQAVLQEKMTAPELYEPANRNKLELLQNESKKLADELQVLYSQWEKLME